MSQLATTQASQLEAISNGVAIRNIDDVSRMSKMFAASGFFNDCKEAAQAGVKIMAGQEVGIPPFAAMNGIHVIKGKATIGAGLMAAKLKGSAKYSYRVLEHTPQVCTIEVLERFDGKMQSAGKTSFTIDEARKAGCQNLDKYARNMLFARAISNAVRFYAPDLFIGSVYTPEEMGAIVNEDGDIVEVMEAEEIEPKAIAPTPKRSPQYERIVWFQRRLGQTVDQIKEMIGDCKLPPSAKMNDQEAQCLIKEMLTVFYTVDGEVPEQIFQGFLARALTVAESDEQLMNELALAIEAWQHENEA